MKDNTLDFNFTPQTTEPYLIFSRDFHNIKGGRISIKVNNSPDKIIATKTKFENKFIWKKVGKFNLTKNIPVKIQLNNLEGFNASNLIAVIPKSEFEKYTNIFNQKIKETSQLILLETDIEFEKLGHKQIEKNNPNYTNGRAIRLNSGFLRTKFSVIKDGRFKIKVRTEIMNNVKNLNKKEIFMEIQNQSGKTIYQEKIPLKKDKIIFSNEKKAREMWWISLPDKFFKKGKYQLILRFNDQSKSLINLSDFRGWDNSEFKFKTPPLIEKERECSKYVKTKKQDFKSFLVKNNLHAEITQGVSCDWQTLVSNPIRVKSHENYLINFEINSQNTNKLHFKINFFDRHNRFIAKKQLAFPNQQSFPFFKIEELIKIPEKAVQMQLQILVRQNPLHTGKFEIKHFTVKKFEDLPLVDLVAIYEKWSLKKSVPTILDIKKNYLSYDILLSANPMHKLENFTLQMGESFHILWSMLDSQQNKEITAQPVFMTLNSFQIQVGNQPKKLTYQFRATQAYYLGLSITGGSLLFIIIWFWFIRPKKKKKKNNNSK